jgi:hypothetical protein
MFKITYKDGARIRVTKAYLPKNSDILAVRRRFYKWHDYSAVIYDISPTVLPDYPLA